jgi:hypothetical protein
LVKADFSEYGFDVAAGTRPRNIEERYGTIKFYFVNVDNYVNSAGVSGKPSSVTSD